MFSLGAKNLRPQVFGEAEVLIQSALSIGRIVGADIDVDDGKFGIVSPGYAAEHHLPALARIVDAEVAAVDYTIGGEALLLALDSISVAVSSGSACATGSSEPSPVLTAMGLPPEEARASLRFSLGRFTSEEEIDAAIAAGFPQIKFNAVLMKGRNDDEIFDLIEFARQKAVTLRFIELMPVSLTEMLSEKNFLPVTEVLAMLRREDELEELREFHGYGPARYFRLKKRGVTVGLIGALSDLHFCERCNKMRLTCDGKLRPCLGNHLEMDLKPALRPVLDKSKLENLFRATLTQKPPEHLFRHNYQPQRVMTAIGG